MRFPLTLPLCFLCFLIRAQGNLVPNPGFENDTACPASAGQIYLAPPWQTYNTADLFDSCAAHPADGVPDNFMGWQLPHTGHSYGAIVTYVHSSLVANYREFIQAPLPAPMKAGTTYHISYYVSLAELSNYASPDVGAYFSDTAIRPISGIHPNYSLGYAAQVENPVTHPITSTTEWLLISGDYVARGGERFITIGNFKPDAEVTYTLRGTSGEEGTDLYIDDISLYEKIAADAGAGANICIGDSVRIGSPAIDGVSYHWSPATGLSDSSAASPWAKPGQSTTYRLMIEDGNGMYSISDATDVTTITVTDCTPPEFAVPSLLRNDEVLVIPRIPPGTLLELYDMQGKLMLSQADYQNDFSALQLGAGLYSYHLLPPGGKMQKGKICIFK